MMNWPTALVLCVLVVCLAALVNGHLERLGRWRRRPPIPMDEGTGTTTPAQPATTGKEVDQGG